MAVIIGLVQAESRRSAGLLRSPDPGSIRLSFFGFYNMLGKFASIVGPALMGTVGLLVRQALMPPHLQPSSWSASGRPHRAGAIASLLVLFALGAILLSRVKDGNEAGP